MWVPEERLKLWARWAAHMAVKKQVLELREGIDYNLLQYQVEPGFREGV